MTFQPHDLAILVRALPEHGLRVGTVGTVVFSYDEHVFEVEFVGSSGRTDAVVTVDRSDIRPLMGRDPR